MATEFDLRDPALREELAKQSYYRDRVDDTFRDRETDVDDETETVYVAVAWENLTGDAQRPYRTAVETCLDWMRDL